jgi:Fe-S-cluster-containing dehydrogenase component
MTTLPPPSPRKLGLVIDLDTCVGCHACAVLQAVERGRHRRAADRRERLWQEPFGVWFNRVHSYEVAATPSSQR